MTAGVEESGSVSTTGARRQMHDAFVGRGHEERAVGAHRGGLHVRHHAPAHSTRFEIDPHQVSVDVDGVRHPPVEVDTDGMAERRGGGVGSPAGGDQALGNERLDRTAAPREAEQ
jgi:hypothetical protein